MYLYSSKQILCKRVLNWAKKSLNLTTVELRSDYSGSLASFCIALLKASPNLSKLRIEDAPSHDFIKTLADHPELGNRLEEFSWTQADEERLRKNDHAQKVLELIAKLEFSPKLKTLRLESSQDLQNLQSDCNFIQILKKVSGSLENLELKGRYCLTSENERVTHEYFPKLSEENFPIIRSLKVLKIDSGNAYGFRDISVLKKFPNLHTFWLKLEVDKDFLKEHQWKFFGNMHLTICPENQHENLKRLILVEPHLKATNYLNGMVAMFPNLQCLSVGVKYVKGRKKHLEHLDLNIEKAVGILSKLENLKELTLHNGGKTTSVEVGQVLGELTSFQKLERFVLNQRSGDVRFGHADVTKSYEDLCCQKDKDIVLIGFNRWISAEDEFKVLTYIRENELRLQIYKKLDSEKYSHVLEV